MKEKKISEELKYCLEGNCGSCSSYSIGAVVTCPKLLEKAHETIREYESIGLLPEQIREIDKLYTEKCEEVAKLQKELKRYRYLEEQCIFENAVGIEVMLKKFGEFMSDMHELCEYKELEREGKLIKLIWAAGDAYFKIETAFQRNEQECKRCRYYHEGDETFRDDSCCLFEEEEWPSCAKVIIKIFKNVEEIIHCMENDSVGKTVFFTKKRQERHWKNQVKEIIMGQTKNDFDGFKEAMQPAIEWLQKNGNYFAEKYDE